MKIINKYLIHITSIIIAIVMCFNWITPLGYESKILFYSFSAFNFIMTLIAIFVWVATLYLGRNKKSVTLPLALFFGIMLTLSIITQINNSSFSYEVSNFVVSQWIPSVLINGFAFLIPINTPFDFYTTIAFLGIIIYSFLFCVSLFLFLRRTKPLIKLSENINAKSTQNKNSLYNYFKKRIVLFAVVLTTITMFLNCWTPMGNNMGFNLSIFNLTISIIFILLWSFILYFARNKKRANAFFAIFWGLMIFSIIFYPLINLITGQTPTGGAILGFPFIFLSWFASVPLGGLSYILKALKATNQFEIYTISSIIIYLFFFIGSLSSYLRARKLTKHKATKTVIMSDSRSCLIEK